VAGISPNLRELEALFATHNPKVAGSNPARWRTTGSCPARTVKN
jgi:hypothetical protein